MTELRINKEKLKIYSSKLDACFREFSASFSNFSFSLPNSSEFNTFITTNNNIKKEIKIIIDNYSKQNKMLTQYITEFENIEKSLVNNTNITNIQEVQSLIKALPEIKVDDISFDINIEPVLTPQQEQAKQAAIARGMEMAREAAAAAASQSAGTTSTSYSNSSSSNTTSTSISNSSSNQNQEITYENFGELSKDMLDAVVNNNGNINCSAEEFADQLLACGVNMGMTSEDLIKEIEAWNAEARNIRDQIKSGNYANDEELNNLKQTLNTIGNISSAYQQNYGTVNTYEGQQKTVINNFSDFASSDLTMASANAYIEDTNTKITNIYNSTPPDSSNLKITISNNRINLYGACQQTIIDNAENIAELDSWKNDFATEYINFTNNVSCEEDFDNYLNNLQIENNSVTKEVELLNDKLNATFDINNIGNLADKNNLDNILNIGINSQKQNIINDIYGNVSSTYENIKAATKTNVGTEVTTQTAATIDPEVAAYNNYRNEIDSQIVESEASIKNMESMLSNPYLPTESKNQIIENINNEKAKINELEARKSESVYITEQQLEQYKEEYGSYLTMDPYAPGMPSDVSEIILNYQSMEKQYEYQYNITLKNATLENVTADLDAAKKELDSAKNIVTSVPGMPSSVTSILENQKQEKINATTEKIKDLEVQSENATKEFNKIVNGNLIAYADSLEEEKSNLVSDNINLEASKQSYMPTSEINKINQLISDNNEKYSNLRAEQEVYYEMAELDLTNNDNLKQLVDDYSLPETEKDEYKYQLFLSTYQNSCLSQIEQEKQVLADYEQQKTAAYLPTSELNRINALIDNQKETITQLETNYDNEFNLEKLFVQYVENDYTASYVPSSDAEKIREQNKKIETKANAFDVDFEATLNNIKAERAAAEAAAKAEAARLEAEANKSAFEKWYDTFYNFGAEMAQNNAENQMKYENGEIGAIELVVNSTENFIMDSNRAAGATITHGAISALSGFEQGAEGIVDFFVTGGVGIGSFGTLIADAITGKIGDKDSATQQLYDWKDEFVATEWIGNVEDSLFKTEIGKYVDENSLITRGGMADNILHGLGEVGFVMISSGISTTTGANAGSNAYANVFAKGGTEAAAKTAAQRAAFAANAVPIATIKGIGVGNERALQDGATSVEAGIYGLASGGWEGIQWAAGLGINNATISGLAKATTISGKAAVLGTSVAADALDSGIEGIVQPGLQMIYKDGTYEEIFEQNGGWENVETQAIIGGIMSMAGTADDFSRSIKSSTAKDFIDANTTTGNVKPDINVQDVKNAYKDFYFGKTTEKELDAAIADMLKTSSNKNFDGLNPKLNSNLSSVEDSVFKQNTLSAKKQDLADKYSKYYSGNQTDVELEMEIKGLEAEIKNLEGNGKVTSDADVDRILEEYGTKPKVETDFDNTKIEIDSHRLTIDEIPSHQQLFDEIGIKQGDNIELISGMKQQDKLTSARQDLADKYSKYYSGNQTDVELEMQIKNLEAEIKNLEGNGKVTSDADVDRILEEYGTKPKVETEFDSSKVEIDPHRAIVDEIPSQQLFDQMGIKQGDNIELISGMKQQDKLTSARQDLSDAKIDKIISDEINKIVTVDNKIINNSVLNDIVNKNNLKNLAITNKAIDFGKKVAKASLALPIEINAYILKFKNAPLTKDVPIYKKVVDANNPDAGLYHFTKIKSANAIMESSTILASKPSVAAYGNNKAFMFAGIPDFDNYRVNVGVPKDIEIAVKINPTDADINNMTYRTAIDETVMHSGAYKFDNANAELVFMKLIQTSDGTFKYEPVISLDANSNIKIKNTDIINVDELNMSGKSFDEISNNIYKSLTANGKAKKMQNPISWFTDIMAHEFDQINAKFKDDFINYNGKIKENINSSITKSGLKDVSAFDSNNNVVLNIKSSINSDVDIDLKNMKQQLADLYAKGAEANPLIDLEIRKLEGEIREIEYRNSDLNALADFTKRQNDLIESFYQRGLLNEKINSINGVKNAQTSTSFIQRIFNKELNSLLKTGDFETIYRKYGEKNYNAHSMDMMKYEEAMAGVKYTSEHFKLSVNEFAEVSAIVGSILPPVLFTLALVGEDANINNNEKLYAEEIEKYNEQVSEYAEEIKKLNLNDIQTIMKVTYDMWDNVIYDEVITDSDEYTNDISGFYRLNFSEDGPTTEDGLKRGVCRHMADDVAAKLNAINPKYNARIVPVTFLRSNEVNYNVYPELWDYRQFPEKETISDQTSDQKSNENHNTIDVTASDLQNKIFGNHMVTMIDIPEENITLILDPTNPAISLYRDGEIYTFDRQDGKGLYFPHIMFHQGSDVFGNYMEATVQSYFSSDESIESLNKKYGIEAQNEALQQIIDMENE